MRITESKLRKLIREEIQRLNEEVTAIFRVKDREKFEDLISKHGQKIKRRQGQDAVVYFPNRNQVKKFRNDLPSDIGRWVSTKDH